jgi:hypothetical protein
VKLDTTPCAFERVFFAEEDSETLSEDKRPVSAMPEESLLPAACTSQITE